MTPTPVHLSAEKKKEVFVHASWSECYRSYKLQPIDLIIPTLKRDTNMPLVSPQGPMKYAM